MKDDPGKEAARRLQALIARETGAPLKHAAMEEMESIIRSAGGDAGGDDAIQADHSFERRKVTILFADLRGFSALTATQPAGAMITLLNRCFGRMNEIVALHQGIIDKFMGDSIMVLFGAPIERPDDVQRALACAIEMQRAMIELNHRHRQDGMPDLYMGIGINTGNVMAGRFGSDFYSEYTVIGDEVNLASRIEAFSLRGQVLISENTLAHCRDFVTVGEAMEVFVKGKTPSVRLHELLEIPSRALKVPRQAIRDIGYHGLLIELDHPIEAHDEVRLEFELPLVDFTATDIYARVVKVEPGINRRFAGIEFTSINPETNMKLQLFVQLLVAATA